MVHAFRARTTVRRRVAVRRRLHRRFVTEIRITNAEGFDRAAQGADLVLAEGSMGLFDGVARPGALGRGSSADALNCAARSAPAAEASSAAPKPISSCPEVSAM